jgi:hypothetical protein
MKADWRALPKLEKKGTGGKSLPHSAAVRLVTTAGANIGFVKKGIDGSLTSIRQKLVFLETQLEEYEDILTKGKNVMDQNSQTMNKEPQQQNQDEGEEKEEDEDNKLEDSFDFDNLSLVNE